MTAATLVLLALSAAVSVAPTRIRAPHWAVAAASTTLLALAAITGALTTQVHGFTLAVTYIVTVSAAVAGGSPIVTTVFKIARRGETPNPDSENPDSEDTDSGPLHGGRTIGVLERTAVAASILTGWPEGIAIVLAVKGLARYPELRGTDGSAASEQFIIGTFTSVMWAVAVCGIGLSLAS